MNNPSHGRRSGKTGPRLEDEKNGAGARDRNVKEFNTDTFETVEAGVDQEMANRPTEVEDLTGAVAAAPVEYHRTMPKLAELAQGGSKLSNLQQQEGIDLSLLTSVLVGDLDDEDVPWIPELLMVQLTSELVDHNGEQGENDENGGGAVESPSYAKRWDTAKAGEMRPSAAASDMNASASHSQIGLGGLSKNNEESGEQSGPAPVAGRRSRRKTDA